MKKSYSLLISAIITLFCLIYLHSDKDYLESVYIARVIDGDTLVTSEGRVLRLANINSPEKGFFNYEPSIDFLSNFINKSVSIDVLSLDKYGVREVVDMYASGRYINLYMVESGLVPKSWVDTKKLSDFSQAEESAINGEKGIWKNSEYKGCINISIDPFNEEVLMKNLCYGADFGELMLKDESREYITFNFSGNSLLLKSGNFSKSFQSSSNIIYWKSENIWNNDRDTLYLFDSEGNIIYYSSYGYL